RENPFTVRLAVLESCGKDIFQATAGDFLRANAWTTDLSFDSACLRLIFGRGVGNPPIKELPLSLSVAWSILRPPGNIDDWVAGAAKDVDDEGRATHPCAVLGKNEVAGNRVKPCVFLPRKVVGQPPGTIPKVDSPTV